MAISSISNSSNYISLSNRAEQINTVNNRIANNNRQIIDNNRQIASLENQITAQQEVSTTLKEIMVNNTDSINIIKEMISNNDKIISNNEKSINFLQETQVLAKEAHAVGESRLKNLQETQVLAKEAHAVGESRLKNLQETQVLAKEQRDLTQKCIDIVEKMLAIVMKNPAKYENMRLEDFSKIPKIVTTKINDYPQENRADLMNVANRVIDNCLDKKSFFNLEQKIDLAFSKEISAKLDRFDKSSVNIYRANQNLFNEYYFSYIKDYSF